MKSKIIVGVIVAIVIVAGIGYGLSEPANDSNQVMEDFEEVLDVADNNEEGKSFTLELSDSVNAVGQP